MSAWIRFHFENGDSILIKGEDAYFVFKMEERQIEVYSMRALAGKDTLGKPICVYPCEFPDQVAAAEETIYDALGKGEPLTISLDSLDEQAEYLNNVTGLRMVLQLLHQGAFAFQWKTA